VGVVSRRVRDHDKRWASSVIGEESIDRMITVTHHNHSELCINSVWDIGKSDPEHHPFPYNGVFR
jgi:hypothetical protein